MDGGGREGSGTELLAVGEGITSCMRLSSDDVSFEATEEFVEKLGSVVVVGSIGRWSRLYGFLYPLVVTILLGWYDTRGLACQLSKLLQWQL